MKLELTTEQVNQVLNALAQQPYIQINVIARYEAISQEQHKIASLLHYVPLIAMT